MIEIICRMFVEFNSNTHLFPLLSASKNVIISEISVIVSELHH